MRHKLAYEYKLRLSTKAIKVLETEGLEAMAKEAAIKGQS